MDNTEITEQPVGKAAWIVLLASIVGAALSWLSLYQHTELVNNLKAAPSFCNISAAFNCDAVNTSEWASLLGVPLASYGLVFYIAVFCLFLSEMLFKAPSRKILSEVLLVLGVVAALYSLYLFFVSKFLLHTICIVCIGMYAANFTYLFTALFMNRDKALLKRLWDGSGYLCAFPLVVLGVGGYRQAARRRLAWNGAKLLVALILVVYLLPNLVFLPLIKRAYTGKITGQTGGELERGFLQWKKAPQQQVPLALECGAQGDYHKGSVSAPIQIIEFADFQCPACRSFYEQVEGLLEEYPDQILFVYKNFPLDQSCNPIIKHEYHKYACYAALFTLCAGEQGKYWEAVDYFFHAEAFRSASPDWKVRESVNRAIDQMELDRVGIEECLESTRYRDRLLREIKEAEKLGLTGTPFVFVNNKVLKHRSENVLRQVFEDILSQQ